jgi:hypothetical protein
MGISKRGYREPILCRQWAQESLTLDDKQPAGNI